MNSFSNAQFNYSPFIWMLHGRKNKNKIKHLYERCLRLIYNDKKSSYENLLEKDNSVSIHHKSVQALVIEMFNVEHKLSQKLLVIFLWKRQTIRTICVTVLIL